MEQKIKGVLRVGNGESTIKYSIAYTEDSELIYYLGECNDYTTLKNAMNRITPYVIKNACLDNFLSCNNLFDYQNELTSIDLVDVKNVESLTSFCAYSDKLRYVKFKNAENVTNMTQAFYHCDGLEEVHGLEENNLNDIHGIFCNCLALKELPKIDTSKVTNMASAYSELTVEHIKVNTDSVININRTFMNCHKVKTIDITTLDNITSETNTTYMAGGCSVMTKFIIRKMTKVPIIASNIFVASHHMLGTVNETYNPNGDKDGRIYVPDDWVETLKSATNWSVYADIIVPLSTLEE